VPPSRDVAKLRHLLPFVRPYLGRVAVVAVALVVSAGAMLALGSGLRWLVDSGFQGGEARYLDLALVAMFAIVVVLATATFARSLAVNWVGERVVADLRKAVYGNLLRLSPSFFELNKTGEVMSRLTTDTTLLQTVIGSTISMALRNALMILGGIIMMAVTSPRLTAFALLVVPAAMLPIAIFGRRLRNLSRLSQDRIGDVSSNAGESLAAIETVQAFTHEAEDEAAFARTAEAAFEAGVRRSVIRAAFAGVAILLVFTAIAIILWVGGHDMLAGRISPGELSAFLFYAVLVAASMGSLSEFVGDVQRAAGATERLLDLWRAQSDIRPPADPVPLPAPARGEVRFEDVTFAYPTRPESAALRHFDLTIAQGERVALVGPSGAGKTTVFQLLLRFRDPDHGRVLFDGIDLRRLDPKAARSAMALVAQEPVVFAGTVADNIRFGRPDAGDADIRRAAETAAALKFIERLPRGFDTELGERGVGLSGGQRQRIAIARAVLRDPALLLLDEATSALDAQSERMVQSALDVLMAERTTIVIAHRLATVLKADRIVVMDGGRIVATGTHDTLIQQDGLYARLAALQFNLDEPAPIAAAG